VLAGAADKLAELPEGARLGTGSLRRKSQLLAYRSDLEIVPIRGNIESRLEKIKTKKLDGVILAAAGLERLGLKDQITEYLSPEICLPAARQGAVAVEIRKESIKLKNILIEAEDQNTALAVWAEHAFLREMEAGCHAPLAAQAVIKDNKLTLTAAAGELDGSRIIRRKLSTKKLDLKSIRKLGQNLARELKNAGAAEILSRLKS
jgi:hydroxymethylbilane synthase